MGCVDFNRGISAFLYDTIGREGTREKREIHVGFIWVGIVAFIAVLVGYFWRAQEK